MKRIISVIVVFALCFSIMPAGIFAEEHNVQNTEDVISEPNSTSIPEGEGSEDKLEEQTEIDVSEAEAETQDEASASEQEKSDQPATDETEVKDESAEPTEQTDTPVAEQDETKEQEPAAKEEEPKYNELGIKEGTMVYGMDISKLSKEQLQYIPIDWRDGVDETEVEPSSEPKLSKRASYPDVNDWIKKNAPSTSSIKYEHKSQFAKFNYRNGRGAVEGVVAHETANPNSSIRSEINYMEQNHNNAFVHAFVDHGNIIETVSHGNHFIH